MIKHILQPLVCERFKNDKRYREGHLRVVNALPSRLVLGLHSPDMKQTAKSISREGCQAAMPDGEVVDCRNAADAIGCFEKYPQKRLCYEETVVWGYLINQERCSTSERLSMLARYIPVIDNWAVCDSYCANAKWMARADKEQLWEFLRPYFGAKREFEVRFAIVASMCYFLNDEWLPKLFAELAKIDFDNIDSAYTSCKKKPEKPQEGKAPGNRPYYVRMGVAWLLATALAKFPDATREFARNSGLPQDVIKLYVRKARESLRTRTVNAL
ncbi:MAG: DNA alkylation repair protein [Bacteroidales bacterium]|nr:DNA alkylation repair protein [Bacteroidales bacterium]